MASNRQDLDYRYRVTGDRDVVRSLERVSTRLDDVDKSIQRVNKSGGKSTGITRVASGLGSMLRGVTSTLSGTIRSATSGVTQVSSTASRAVQTVTAVTKTSAGAVTTATNAATRATGKLAKSTASIFISLKRLSLAGTVLAGVLGYKVGTGVAGAEQAMGQFSLAMQQATGSAAKAGDEIAYVQKLAADLGTSFTDLRAPYAGLANAVTGAGASMDIARENFQGIIEASQALGVATPDVQRALLAVSQVAGKGRVSLEEISQQLGEVIPGATSLAAKSMGMTTAAFIKMVSAGKIQAIPFLTNFGKTLHETFGENAKQAADDFQSSRARITNSFDQLKLTIGKSGVTDAMKRLFNTIAKIITGFNSGGAKAFGTELALKIDAFTDKLSRNAGRIGAISKRIYASFVLMTRGQQAYREVLLRLNDDGKSNVATLGSGATTNKYAAALGDQKSYSRLESKILSMRRAGIAMYEALGNGARAAFIAFSKFVQGFTKGKGAFGTVAAGATTLTSKLVAMSRVFLAFASGDTFMKLGQNVRFAYNFITSYTRALFNDTRVVIDDTVRYLYSKLPFGVRQMASAMGGAFESIMNLAKGLYPIFEPLVRVFANFFGVANSELGMFKTKSEKLASPFLLLSMVINRNLANGNVEKFAKSGAKAMERFIKAVKLTITVIGLLFKPSKDNDKKIIGLLPNAGEPLIDLRDGILAFIALMKRAYSAVKGFWKEWGPAIKKGYASLMGFLDKLAPYFGVKDGKEVLILLILFKLIGGFKILGFLLGTIGKAVGFVFLLALLIRIRTIILAVSAGTMTLSGGLGAITKLAIGEALARMFGLGFRFLMLFVGGVKLLWTTFTLFLSFLSGSFAAVFEAIATKSFGPITAALQVLKGQIVSILGGIWTSIASRVGPVFQAIKLIGTVLFKVFRFAGSLVWRFIWQRLILGAAPALSALFGLVTTFFAWVGGLIAAAAAAAPVLFALAVAALVIIVVAIAYKFRKQIEDFFASAGEWVYGWLESIFGKRVADIVTGVWNAMTAPIRLIWTTLMDFIDDTINKGFWTALTNVWNKIMGWGKKFKDWFLGLFNVNTEVNVKTTGAKSATDTGSGMPAFADGGRVRGKGGPRSDSILAWLSNGEYVINARAAAMFRPILDAINYGGSSLRGAMGRLGAMKLPAFANGGSVAPGLMQGLNRMAAPAGGNMSNVDIYLPGARAPLDIPLESPLGGNDLLKRLRRAYTGQVRNGPRFMR